MGSLKASGDDGLSAGFYKENWTVVGNSLKEFVMNSWQVPKAIADVNNTLIALVPKINQPDFVNQLRPIALCNVSYKTITKIIGSRIKPILDNRISPAQSSFISGRRIQDNITVAQKITHSMRKKIR
ncbi:uncharacterized protein LOC130949884 [Arachis stenosperma]|uniref:uncharacterized protein LOC130949884 n=1 Tax=Arachis stenosperma TaxID=217475 RepID=UPI0025ABD6CA|nr:uncharacterized protein LOC130949884 [Arachis stenosperma]